MTTKNTASGLVYSKKDRGFYLLRRRDLDLAWQFLDDDGEVIGSQEPMNLSPYEKILHHHRQRLGATS